jgi:hypothetical protein
VVFIPDTLSGAVFLLRPDALEIVSNLFFFFHLRDFTCRRRADFCMFGTNHGLAQGGVLRCDMIEFIPLISLFLWFRTTDSSEN